jgi:Flp pilus assembly protein CpaB
MKNRVVILLAVLVITVGIVGVLARNGSKDIKVNADAGEQAVQNTVVDSTPVAAPHVERVDVVNVGALEHEQDAGDFSNLSRGYIDVDMSGDWSEGDIPLDKCDDGYIIPIEIN